MTLHAKFRSIVGKNCFWAELSLSVSRFTSTKKNVLRFDSNTIKSGRGEFRSLGPNWRLRVRKRTPASPMIFEALPRFSMRLAWRYFGVSTLYPCRRK